VSAREISVLASTVRVPMIRSPPSPPHWTVIKEVLTQKV
jgi:hypothetical protein